LLPPWLLVLTHQLTTAGCNLPISHGRIATKPIVHELKSPKYKLPRLFPYFKPSNKGSRQLLSMSLFISTHTERRKMRLGEFESSSDSTFGHHTGV
jgi:hypothetical protein